MSLAPYQAQPFTVPVEIAEIIVEFVSYDLAKFLVGREIDDLKNNWYWRSSLACLKAVSRAFRAAINRLLYREIEIHKISPYHLRVITVLLESPAICLAVRSFTFKSMLCIERPCVRSFWYRSSEFDKCSGAPFWSCLDSAHERRMGLARHYDGQKRMMQSSKFGLKWFWAGLQELLLGRSSSPPTSRLRTFPWFTGVHKFVNLQELKIVYGDPERRDYSTHYLINNDISAGLANILTSLTQLRSLNVANSTLTDLRNLVHFIYETGDTPSVVAITSLEISIVPETLLHRGGTIYWSEGFRPGFNAEFQAHNTAGRPISDLLDLFSQLEMLNLYYNREKEWGFLIVQDLRKAVLPRLQKLTMRGFACK